MEKAIKLAIEGGYDIQRGRNRDDLVYERLWCDETFWQALGKALKWPELYQPYQTGNGNWTEIFWWEYKWHEFIHHLAEGKNPETFFTNLLTEQES